MKILFIRHGETDWNVSGKIQGTSDIPLNKTGILQAKQSCLNFDKNKEYALYSSAKLRALQTATVVGKHLNVPVIVMDGLNEINLGKWESRTWDEVAEKYPNDFHFWKENRSRAKPHGGESYLDLLDRVIVSLQAIIKQEEKDIIVCTHSLVIMIISCFMADVSFNEVLRFLPKNCEVVSFDARQLLEKIDLYQKKMLTF